MRRSEGGLGFGASTWPFSIKFSINVYSKIMIRVKYSQTPGNLKGDCLLRGFRTPYLIDNAMLVRYVWL